MLLSGDAADLSLERGHGSPTAGARSRGVGHPNPSPASNRDILWLQAQFLQQCIPAPGLVVKNVRQRQRQHPAPAQLQGVGRGRVCGCGCEQKGARAPPPVQRPRAAALQKAVRACVCLESTPLPRSQLGMHKHQTVGHRTLSARSSNPHHAERTLRISLTAG